MKWRSNETCGPLQTPVRGPLTSLRTNQNVVFIIYPETDVLCTGLQLQFTVNISYLVTPKKFFALLLLGPPCLRGPLRLNGMEGRLLRR